MLPALRMTNISPGSRWVTSSGTTRLSEGDEQRPGRLRMRQLVEQLDPLTVFRLAKLQKSSNEVIHGLPHLNLSIGYLGRPA
jgi:hypothetical protein